MHAIVSSKSVSKLSTLKRFLTYFKIVERKHVLKEDKYIWSCHSAGGWTKWVPEIPSSPVCLWFHNTSSLVVLPLGISLKTGCILISSSHEDVLLSPKTAGPLNARIPYNGKGSRKMEPTENDLPAPVTSSTGNGWIKWIFHKPSPAVGLTSHTEKLSNEIL